MSTIITNETVVRRKSRIVNIGDVPLGGHYPIRLQSMTTTDTMDTEATIAQSIRMIEAGSEYVRITAPSLHEAENLKNIKDGLRKLGYTTPLIADIHFTPNAAELAARIVEKVRINPGNYIDKKKFEVKEYTDSAYEAELERIRARFSPLVKICKEYGTAMRIGTNHGSLSDRIMNRYGDTPEGMVESAMEFLRICGELDYHNIVLSMKASNPIVMIQAYRQLVAKMQEEDMYYPLHLGVTEAGEGEEGRIKSAMGIGTLLAEGLGDTIRVSLTEEPELEIPVARIIATRYDDIYKARLQKPAPLNLPKGETFGTLSNSDITDSKLRPLPFGAGRGGAYQRRHTHEAGNVGGHNVPRVIVDFSELKDINELSLRAADYYYNALTDKWNTGDCGADYLYFGNNIPSFMLPGGAKGVYEAGTWAGLEDKINNFPVYSLDEYHAAKEKSTLLNFIRVEGNTALPALNRVWLKPYSIERQLPDAIRIDNTIVFILHINKGHESARDFFLTLEENKNTAPVILQSSYKDITKEEFLVYSAADAGSLLADGFGDGIFIQYHPKDEKQVLATTKLVNRTSFNILQASRMRMSRTEYISCPSCGRTLFDLQETTAMIRKETDHLKGVKIAIMGCIVNGPGEMADADYGYVGTGPGKITLYRGKDVVTRNLDSHLALKEMIKLIKTDGYWIEKQ